MPPTTAFAAAMLAVTPPSGRVHAGMPVRLVLRRLHEGGGVAHYFWKLLPEGGSGGGEAPRQGARERPDREERS